MKLKFKHRSEPGTHERNARVIELHEGGCNLRSIAEDFGISKQRVHQIIGNAKAKVIAAQAQTHSVVA